MKTKPAGSFSKVRKLTGVLKKCNGKAVVGDSGALLSPGAAKALVYCGVLALAGALFLGAFFIGPYISRVIPVPDLTRALMLILLLMSFVMAVKDIVTVLYTADDLELLLPMPFSAGQIVTAKLAVISVFPVTVSLVVLNAVCLGLGIRQGAGAPFIIGTLLSSVLIPVTGIAAAALLVVILFRVFGFIRNRDITVALGGLFTFGLSIAYIIINSRLQQGRAGEEASAALHAAASVSSIFPNIYFMNRFMSEGSVPALLLSLAVTAALTALTMLAVRAFYFSTALSMQTTGSGRKAVSKASLRSGRKNDALWALTVYEAKSARRNPAYMIYGFVMSFLWPVLFALPFVFGDSSLLGGIAFPLEPVPALAASVSFGMAASCFACGFNILPGTAFSREGASFAAIRALPVDPGDYYRSKRNFSLLVCSLGSVMYVILLGLGCIAAGVIPLRGIWIVPAGACVCFLLNLILIDLMLLKNSVKPHLTWDSETELARKLGAVNLIAIVIGVIMIVIFLAVLSQGAALHGPGAEKSILAGCAAAAMILLVLALAVDRRAVRKAAKNLMELE